MSNDPHSDPDMFRTDQCHHTWRLDWLRDVWWCSTCHAIDSGDTPPTDPITPTESKGNQ